MLYLYVYLKVAYVHIGSKSVIDVLLVIISTSFTLNYVTNFIRTYMLTYRSTYVRTYISM